MTKGIDLSIVVALISGNTSDLDRCLRSLVTQTFEGSLEIIVPYDPPCAHVCSLQEDYPTVRFHAADHLNTALARQGAAREHHDALRTIGIRAAKGTIVALTEDHAVALEGWCRQMVSLLEENEAVAAVGGAVDCRAKRCLQQAVYLCDFGRYQNPLREGVAEFVSDSNVFYRASALRSVEDAWRDDYHETLVHDALTAGPCEIWLTPRTTVLQERTQLTMGMACRERFVWARSYAGTRVSVMNTQRRLIMIVLSFLLPFLMTLRLYKGLMERDRLSVRTITLLPLILLLQTFWGLGEFVGYVTGRESNS